MSASSNGGALRAFRGSSVGVKRVKVELVAQSLFSRPVSFEPVARDWIAWCRPSVRRPCAVSRRPSVGVDTPSPLPIVGRTPEGVSAPEVGCFPGICDCDGILVRHYGYPG